jgi:CRISPR-associated protein Csm4
MTLYRIRFELCSAIVTPLKGDTIWGHIVWGIANHEGDEDVAAFLEQEKANPPVLVVSSAFPAGMLCRDLPTPKLREDTVNIEKYSKIKKDKKVKYMPSSEYISDTEVGEIIRESPLKSVQVMHNIIDRETNTVLADNGLFPTEEKWPGIMEGNRYKNIDWDVYILSTYSKERIKQLVEWAFENGYGADASVGKGKIRIKGDPISVTPKKQGNMYMALGPFVNPPDSGLSSIRADVFIRSGKIGGAFASSMSPYKKPVVLYDEGAVFNSNTPLEYVGTLLTGMHEDPRICQSGFAPVIPVE